MDVAPTAVLELKAKAKLPVVGIVDVNGNANTAFDDYALTANGAVSVPLSVKEIHYRLYAIPGNHDFDWWWYTPDGREIHYRTNAPAGDLIDEEEVRSELYKMVAVSLDSSLVKPCPPLLMKELVESGSQGNVARDELVEDKIAEPIQRASNDLGDLVRSPIMIRIDGDELIVGASGPPVVEFEKAKPARNRVSQNRFSSTIRRLDQQQSNMDATDRIQFERYNWKNSTNTVFSRWKCHN